MDAARQIYESINTWSDVNNLCQRRREEDLHLEFKSFTEDQGDPFGNSSHKVTLAEALSAFANSDGGVVVWGIATGKGKSKSFAERIKPIRLDLAIARLKELEGELVSFAINGIDHKPIESDTQEGFGVVLTYIPPSDRGPHMARSNHQHCYFTRAGSHTDRMEHFAVADMFGRRQRPDLSIRIHDPKTGQDNVIDLSSQEGLPMSPGRLSLKIDNHGRGMARWVMLRMLIPSELAFLLHDPAVRLVPPQDTRWLCWDEKDGRSGVKFDGGSSCVVHVGDDLLIRKMTVNWDEARRHAGKKFPLEYWICAKGMPMKEGTLRLLIKGPEQQVQPPRDKP